MAPEERTAIQELLQRGALTREALGVAQRERFLDKGAQVVFEVVKDGSDAPLDGALT